MITDEEARLRIRSLSEYVRETMPGISATVLTRMNQGDFILTQEGTGEMVGLLFDPDKFTAAFGGLNLPRGKMNILQALITIRNHFNVTAMKAQTKRLGGQASAVS